MKVLRGMKEDPDGLPVCGKLGRYLGARPEGRVIDIEVTLDGRVLPGTEGMSVAPPPPENLEEHRRPPEYGGTGSDPVFGLETDELPEELYYRPDPKDPERHGFIEPAWEMSFDDYQALLCGTRNLWHVMRQ